MTVKKKAGQTFHRLARDIREQFIGESAEDLVPRSHLRVMLYSHDTMGIGHMRRNLLIANQIKQSFPDSSILAIAGAKEAATFSQGVGIDCVTLPSYLKKPDGTYDSRNLSISVKDVLKIRSETILAAVKSYQPSLFIVDNVPSGAGGELLPSLNWLSSNDRCKCVLGLREILDTPEKVASDWKRNHAHFVIQQHYGSIWIYGDPRVYNAIEHNQFADEMRDRVDFTGYLNTQSRLQGLENLPGESEAPYILGTVGGGQDGEELCLNFIEAIRQLDRRAVLLTGPFMPSEIKAKIFNLASTVPSLKVIEFVEEGDLLIRGASHIVAMGGYNTVSAILSYKKPALIVPRVTPRQEQWIRANRLSELGFVTTLEPQELSPRSIAHWVSKTAPDVHHASHSLNMNGLERISELIRAEFPETQSPGAKEIHVANQF